MQITGSSKREAHIFDLVVRCATLLAHAAAASTTAAVESLSNEGVQTAQANSKDNNGDGAVPCVGRVGSAVHDHVGSHVSRAEGSTR